MHNGYYSFQELVKKYGWNCPSGQTIAGQITYAKKRQVIIEPRGKWGKTHFEIVEDNTILPGEEWRIHPNKELDIEVSNMGRVKNATERTYYTLQDTYRGYLRIRKNNKHHLVHRLVMETFCPCENSEKLIVDHINGKKDDNRLENLRWVTAMQNMKYRDENWEVIGECFQQVLQKYGYEETKKKLEELLKD